MRKNMVPIWVWAVATFFGSIWLYVPSFLVTVGIALLLRAGGLFLGLFPLWSSPVCVYHYWDLVIQTTPIVYEQLIQGLSETYLQGYS